MTGRTGPFLLIVNPTAGGGKAGDVSRQATSLLDQARVDFRVAITTSIDHGVEAALGCRTTGEVPVLVGGDGLAGGVGGALADTGIPVGLIPAGRGNDLARGLGIPLETDAAVETLLQGSIHDIDVGEANGKRFLGIASVGFDSDANRIANQAKLLNGRPVYAWAAIRALAGWRPVRFELTTGGARRRVTGHTIAVANNSFYGGGMKMAPDAEIDDGMFDVIVITAVSKLRFLSDFPKVFSGSHVRSEGVETLRTPGVAISASRPLVVYADGDPLTELPATFRVLERALKIICPGDGPQSR